MEIDLNNLGKQLKFSKRGEKTKKKLNDKDMFISLINRIEDGWRNTFLMYEKFGVNLFEYNEEFLLIIEDLLYIKYGDWKTDIILWYMFGRIDNEGNVTPLKLINEKDEDEKVTLSTPTQLWDFLIRVEKIKNTNKEK